MSSVVEAANVIVSKLPKELVDGLPIEFVYLGVMLLSASALLGLVVAPIAGFSTYVERRVAARMQARIGCNRVGPEGLLQFLADGLKLLMKEDNTPKGADVPLFKLAPFLVVMGSFMSFVCVPFGAKLIIADLNIALVYLISVSSFVVVGILLAGWSSNNKWSLLGAMRSAAQIVSYEIPLGMALMVPVILVGSLSLQDFNTYQAGGMRNWIIFQAFPGPFIAFFIYFISALAEANRTPFDLPEAESELVSGYNTEYSGIRWGLFFVGEYANMFLIGAIASTVFFGGWQPSKSHILISGTALFFTFVLLFKSIIYVGQALKQFIKGRKLLWILSNTPNHKMSKLSFTVVGVLSLLGAGLLHTASMNPLVAALIFVGKCYFFVFIMMWIRWTLPRFRVDQMMDLCWKKLIPLALFCLLITATLTLFGGWSGLFGFKG